MENNFNRVLVVDDNPKNLRILADLLNDTGFEVMFALNGQQAIERSVIGNPDIILLDVMMPVMDGFDTCQHLKADDTTKDIPIIFMTALDDTYHKTKGFELGAVDYITKPIRMPEVLARVKTHLNIRRLQEELKEKWQREKEINELKSRFIAIASHDIRNPVSSILLSCNLLKRYGDNLTTERRDTQLKRIERASNQIKRMLDDILVISKAESGKFTPHLHEVNLIEFCNEIVDEFRGISQNTHTITLCTRGEDFETKIDPNLLNHVFTNLLSNAIKYSPKGGEVVFELIHNEKYYIFNVIDEGIGISKEDQQNLFEAFHRGVNVGDISGTGLGLSIAKQFVELHNGEIDVESEIKHGTKFIVKIPNSNKT
jgi:signal transduction histidine kinase